MQVIGFKKESSHCIINKLTTEYDYTDTFSYAKQEMETWLSTRKLTDDDKL